MSSVILPSGKTAELKSKIMISIPSHSSTVRMLYCVENGNITTSWFRKARKIPSLLAITGKEQRLRISTHACLLQELLRRGRKRRRHMTHENLCKIIFSLVRCLRSSGPHAYKQSVSAVHGRHGRRARLACRDRRRAAALRTRWRRHGIRRRY